ncbi:hypothetical protein CISG_01224 [Coccidioides immitis RMSCC 3703]|uniref:Uncharacterized protein n=2 Tax=Coccidioides immitis TaxID=5501 RepID=A0A0J8QVJ3_COCIT|nr:hypothetical protein CIRG_01671 [Coccidioides immitis RMSCC 2394]KMU76491.1 hypothetical protein CISG_01224 [Coccidioides immitis RMSCC 3703]
MALWANSIGCWRKGRNAKGLGVTNICLMEGWEQRDRVVVATAVLSEGSVLAGKRSRDLLVRPVGYLCTVKLPVSPWPENNHVSLPDERLSDQMFETFPINKSFISFHENEDTAHVAGMG